MILLLCRIWARIRYILYLDKHGPWGSDYLALCYYHKYNPKRAEELMDEWYPPVTMVRIEDYIECKEF